MTLFALGVATYLIGLGGWGSWLTYRGEIEGFRWCGEQWAMAIFWPVALPVYYLLYLPGKHLSSLAQRLGERECVRRRETVYEAERLRRELETRVRELEAELCLKEQRT